METLATTALAQRDDKIAQLRLEKSSLLADLRDYASLKDKYAALLRQHEELSEMSKRGEVLLTAQVKEMQGEQDRLRARVESETVQRKRLHNVIEDMKGKIRVYCRVRPMNR